MSVFGLLRSLLLTTIGLVALLLAERAFGPWAAFGAAAVCFLAYVGVVTWRQMRADGNDGDGNGGSDRGQ